MKLVAVLIIYEGVSKGFRLSHNALNTSKNKHKLKNKPKGYGSKTH